MSRAKRNKIKADKQKSGVTYADVNISNDNENVSKTAETITALIEQCPKVIGVTATVSNEGITIIPISKILLQKNF